MAKAALHTVKPQGVNYSSCRQEYVPGQQIHRRQRRLCRKRVVASAQTEAPDWDAERAVLRKRTLKPNQLETLRKFEEEVAIGAVSPPVGQVLTTVGTAVRCCTVRSSIYYECPAVCPAQAESWKLSAGAALPRRACACRRSQQ